MYEPGIRGWWRFLRLPELLRDGDGIRWRQLAVRIRPSARLRQCDRERRYWKEEMCLTTTAAASRSSD
jgi:hypothetical protein